MAPRGGIVLHPDRQAEIGFELWLQVDERPIPQGFRSINTSSRYKKAGYGEADADDLPRRHAVATRHAIDGIPDCFQGHATTEWWLAQGGLFHRSARQIHQANGDGIGIHRDADRKGGIALKFQYGARLASAALQWRPRSHQAAPDQRFDDAMHRLLGQVDVLGQVRTDNWLEPPDNVEHPALAGWQGRRGADGVADHGETRLLDAKLPAPVIYVICRPKGLHLSLKRASIPYQRLG